MALERRGVGESGGRVGENEQVERQAVEQPRGTELGVEVQTRATDGSPRPLHALPTRVAAGEAVTMMLSFDRIDCADIDLDLTTITLRAAPAVGVTRTIQLAVPMTIQRADPPVATFTDGDDAHELGWPAFVFERFCPEMTS